jgi:hypothetical protein
MDAQDLAAGDNDVRRLAAHSDIDQTATFHVVLLVRSKFGLRDRRCVHDKNGRVLNVTLHVRYGEIVGIGSLAGCGKGEIALRSNDG